MKREVLFVRGQLHNYRNQQIDAQQAAKILGVSKGHFNRLVRQHPDKSVEQLAAMDRSPKSKLYWHGDKALTLKDWADELDIAYTTLIRRKLKYGFAKAVTMPKRKVKFTSPYFNRGDGKLPPDR